MINKMKRLIEELNKASDSYYNTGNTIMSDKEFDSKLTALETLEKESGIVMSNSPTQRVGAPVLNKLDKVTHEFKPMLSLAKVHSAEEIIKFANGKELIAMIKLDGLSIRLTYENGKLVRGETRGNGFDGSNVTEHVKQFKNVPLFIDKEGTYVVDGEAIITDEDFILINAAIPEGTEKYKNSRNLASGTLALLDTSLVKERHLRFVVWDVITGSLTRKMEDKLDEVYKLGFETVPYCFPLSQHAVTVTEEDINSINDRMFKEAKDCGYPIDGVVWKLNDIKYGETLGQTSHHFCNAVAFKAKQDVYETTLKEIEFTMGKTGVLCPVAIFEPVIIDGATVERASVHNISILTELDLRVGDTITVYKANQIIPQIAENLSMKNHDSSYMVLPSHCPICGGVAEVRKDNDTLVLVCTNDDCQGKLLGRLSHFVSKNAINIDGLSEATLQFMINKGWIKSFKDLYVMPFRFEVYDEWVSTPGFGKRSVDKLQDALKKSTNTTLERFLYAQSISLIGKSACKDIAKYCHGNIDVFCDIMANGNKREFLSIDGFGQTMLESLENWYENHWIEFLALKNEFNFDNKMEISQNKNETSTDLTGKTFVITGSLYHFDNRDQLKDLLESLGAKVSGSVSAKTFALICNQDAGSSKSKKAVDLGIPVWDEKQLLEFIKK